MTNGKLASGACAPRLVWAEAPVATKATSTVVLTSFIFGLSDICRTPTGFGLTIYSLWCSLTNYDGVPIASPDTRPDVAKPVLYWTPVIDMGNLIFYNGEMFPQWKGSALMSGLGSKTLSRIVVTGSTAKGAERWNFGFRLRDVEVGPDGALWMLEDNRKGGLYRVTPK
jgi:hypothetical protein